MVTRECHWCGAVFQRKEYKSGVKRVPMCSDCRRQLLGIYGGNDQYRFNTQKAASVINYAQKRLLMSTSSILRVMKINENTYRLAITDAYPRFAYRHQRYLFIGGILRLKNHITSLLARAVGDHMALNVPKARDEAIAYLRKHGFK